MDWDVTVATEDDQVFVLVVTVVTDRTLSIFLSHEGTLMWIHVLVLYIIQYWLVISSIIFLINLQLLQYLLILQVILPLLHLLNMLQELFLLLARIHHIQQYLIPALVAVVLLVPLIVLHYVLHIDGVHVREEVLRVGKHLLRCVDCLVVQFVGCGSWQGLSVGGLDTGKEGIQCS